MRKILISLFIPDNSSFRNVFVSINAPTNFLSDNWNLYAIKSLIPPCPYSIRVICSVSNLCDLLFTISSLRDWYDKSHEMPTISPRRALRRIPAPPVQVNRNEYMQLQSPGLPYNCRISPSGMKSSWSWPSWIVCNSSVLVAPISCSTFKLRWRVVPLHSHHLVWKSTSDHNETQFMTTLFMRVESVGNKISAKIRFSRSSSPSEPRLKTKIRFLDPLPRLMFSR